MKVYCPKCAAPSSGDQSFCRECGFELEKIEAALSGESQNSRGRGKDLYSSILSEGDSLFAKVGVAALSVLGMCFFALIFYLVIDKKLFALGRYFEGILFLVIMIIGMVAASLFARASYIKRRSKGAETSSDPDRIVNFGKSTNQLLPESRIDPIPSITDKTTVLLAVEKKAEKQKASNVGNI